MLCKLRRRGRRDREERSGELHYKGKQEEQNKQDKEYSSRFRI